MTRLILAIALLVPWLFSSSVYGQEMMINGDFEFVNPNHYIPPLEDQGYNVEYAEPWVSILSTCDVNHPDAPIDLLGSVPHTGEGNMRLGHIWEYAMGQTLPLTAGQVYEVSFCAERSNNVPGEAREIGIEIITDPSVANGFDPLTDFHPQYTLLVNNNYQCVTYCFTATQSGTHYVIVGGKGPIQPGETASNYQFTYNFDDLSIQPKTDLSDVSVADINDPADLFCLDDEIIFDGSTSDNETSYRWRVWRLLSSGAKIETYSQPWTNGQVGTFNVSDAFESINYSPPSNSCYHVHLFTDNGCQNGDWTDFCFVDPNISFLYNGTPICEGDLVNLSVTGDNGWTYTWSDANGQLASGVGTKTLQVAPEVGNATYTVTVTTPEGCTNTESYTFTVHTGGNIAPWMNGINGNGEYIYYAQAGEPFNFSSLVLNDNSNESLIYSTIDNIPTSITHNISPPPAGQNGGTMNFSMSTSNSDQGVYDFSLIANDRNACMVGIDTFKFTIVIICDQCPVCIGYENRTPSGTPLPAETKAGKCIVAGYNQPVETGTANVLFQAGATIDLGVYFEAGNGFQAVIDPATCVTDCEDCCDDWAGFTYDELPNPFYMNFNDSDPTNDFIQVTDTYHPFCAYNAKGYSFEIVDGSSNPMNNGQTGETTTACCWFQSPAPENPISHASIWWDGYTTNIFGNQVRPNDGVYFYVLKLYGCNGAYEEKQGYISIGGAPPGMATTTTPMEESSSNQQLALSEEVREQLEAATQAREELDKQIELSPNPTTDKVRITGADTDDLAYQLFDDKGNMLTRREKTPNGEFSLAEYPAGTYYVWVFANDTYIVRKLVKL